MVPLPSYIRAADSSKPTIADTQSSISYRHFSHRARVKDHARNVFPEGFFKLDCRLYPGALTVLAAGSFLEKMINMRDELYGVALAAGGWI